MDNAMHGLHERGISLTKAQVDADPSGTKNVSVFDEFLKAAAGSGLTRKTAYPVRYLRRQVVVGHQLWATATRKRERFVGVDRLEYWEDRSTKEAWLRIFIREDKLKRIGVGTGQALVESGLDKDWRHVHCPTHSAPERPSVCFEQIRGTKYSHRAVDVALRLSETVRNKLWAVVLLQPPYRQYYLHLAPQTERKYVLPQLLSIYAVMFYLGSVTRYRPHHFDKLARGKYGPWIEAFLCEQPAQFIYLLASEFMSQEVVRPMTVQTIDT